MNRLQAVLNANSVSIVTQLWGAPGTRMLSELNPCFHMTDQLGTDTVLSARFEAALQKTILLYIPLLLINSFAFLAKK